MSGESSVKLQSAEARLVDLKSSTVALGGEATAAMLSVEDQQQQLTFNRLLTMVILLILCPTEHHIYIFLYVFFSCCKSNAERSLYVYGFHYY